MLQKIFRLNFLKIAPAILCLVLFFIFYFLPGLGHAQSQSADAIAIRIMPNQEHYSISRWYQKNFGGTGSPQLTTVDGYEAIRDGRSVYVNVANVSNANVLFTNVYLISFNQDAEDATIDIFSKILAKWKFNTNKTINGLCRGDNSISCLADSDCPINDYCTSAKARIVRDTKRLSDIAEMKYILNEYKAINGAYPKLSSGTYVPYKTLSVWPSWRGTLSEYVSVALPTDPVNKLGSCSGYDELTCWNESSLSFASALPNLPTNSLVYSYSTDTNGGNLSVCAVFESGLVVSGGTNVGTCANVCLDFDGDGYGSPASSVCPNAGYDCNDADPSVTTGGIEDCFNGSDDDCDGYIDCYDAADCGALPLCTGAFICDDDGVCDAGETCALCPLDNCCTCGNGTCQPDEGECSTCYGPGMDCYCGDTTICSAALEGCDDGNNIAGDGCSATCTIEPVTCYDLDGDGFNGKTAACPAGTDCDDNLAGCGVNCFPGKAETCDGYDNNCDNIIDNGAGISEETCSYACIALNAAYDFNLSRAGSFVCCGDDGVEGNPYQSTESLCSDGRDNDCDGQVDMTDSDCSGFCTDSGEDDFTNMATPGICDQCINLQDNDGDQTAYGENWGAYWYMVDSCDADCGIVAATVQLANYQNGSETSCDGIDNDCDGSIDEGLAQTFYRDSDGDGYGSISVTVSGCVAPTGYVANHTDCNDTNAAINPGTTEVCGNSFDDNCDGNTNEGCTICYRDSDNDGFGNLLVTLYFAACPGPGAYVSNSSDCNDGSNAINPTATEICGNLVDENCIGGLNDGCIDCYRDADGDSFGDPANIAQYALTCPGVGNYVNDNTDCDDTRNYIRPGATEVCDTHDNNCNSQTDEGCDDDGDRYCDDAMPMYNANLMCSLTIYSFPADNGKLGNDCDDSLASIYPGAQEICQDTIDQDCDGSDLSCAGICDDADGDRYIAQTTDIIWCGQVCGPTKNIACLGNTDCSDTEAIRFPGNAENCSDGVDNDCDGDADCADSDCPPCLNPCVFDPSSFSLDCMFSE